ncbi:ewing's tumor-associated antigen 1 [Thalassophryne amazonica]|uniref:ewing's tumor-associated antigen 1 n=1 Tax=Thalassophryne amazonica TaxID=390379 RepID=UPI001471B66C|nr:ewing's tumor-associated antigen 1 [Thalassophryne amazonica]
MNRARRQCPLSAAALPQPPSPAVVSVKPNRLRRSFRRSQSEPRAEAQQPEFKTPTRIPKSRLGGGFNGQSPHNDSDIQHDIIWDATSPSPNRLSKKGKKISAGVVNISEIVSRIAPKHGRPEVAEPTLQQWIGDSAAIPCTPDVQLPKPKKKTPRPNAVDDLLKLAKQFDFTMFQNDESDAEDLHQQSLELLSEDILDFHSGAENEDPAVVHPPADLRMEDDLDFLFDGPTQHISRNLSQASSAHPSQLKPEASGKLPVPSHSHISVVSMTRPKGTSANAFEDDWENDDLLNDSLVFEMTQNPHKFLTSNHCSTQKTSSETGWREHAGSDPDCGIVGRGEPAVSEAGKDNLRHTVSEKTVPADSLTSLKSCMNTSRKAADKGPQQITFSSNKGVTPEAGSKVRWQTCQSKALISDPPGSQFIQKTCVMGSGINRGTAEGTTSQTFPKKTSLSVSTPKPAEHRETPTVSVNIQNSIFLDEDLDSFFLSEPAWDDLDDDDLLCEVSEDLENQIQSVDNSSTTCTVGPTCHQRLVLQPSNWNYQAQGRLFQPASQPPASMQPFPKTQTSGSLYTGSCRPAAASSYPSNIITNLLMNQAKNPPGCTNTKVITQTTNSLTHLTSRSRSAAPTSPGHSGKCPSRFTFKKPHTTDSTATSKAGVKCSVAEIELKKQQAMERRHQRLQATQNLRGPT